MDAAIYTRASLDRSGEGAAVSRQAEDAEKLAELRGWRVVARHRDNDTSAAGKARRPGFDALLEDVDAGRVQAVIAWSLDRLTRNRRDTIRLIESCEKAGVTVAMVRGADIDMATPAGRLVADVLSGVARHEIDQKGDRQRRAHQQAIQQGKPPGGRRLFGYSPDGLRVVDAEAALVRAAFDDVIRGASLKGIARTWNEAGATTTLCRLRDDHSTHECAGEPCELKIDHSRHQCVGGAWRHDNVREVLKNPRYAGFATYKGEIVGPGRWKPIIDRDTFETVRGILSMPERRTTAESLARKWLLPGLAFCWKCGSDVATGHTVHGVRTYVCRSRKCVARAAEPIDTFIAGGGVIDGAEQYGLVVHRFARRDIAEAFLGRQAPDLSADRALVRTLNERLADLATGMELGILTLASAQASSDRLRAELADVQARIDASQRADAAGPLAAATEGLEDSGQRLAAVATVWAGYDLAQRRTVIGELMRITLLSPGRGRPRGQARSFNPETVRIEWK